MGGEKSVYIPAPCIRMVHVGKLTGHNGGVSALAVLNNLLITGSRDRLIKVQSNCRCGACVCVCVCVSARGCVCVV